MTILFGHPTGNPNSHNAALAHWQAGRLEAFCVPWMPKPSQLRILSSVPGLGSWAARLERRCFEPILEAHRIEGHWQEWFRMMRRVAFKDRLDGERLSNEANQWLMRTMKKECRRKSVTAVHAFEDCSLWSFEEAKKLGKICIYDMPIGYFPAWQDTQSALLKKYSEWLPADPEANKPCVPLEQKIREMEMADLVLAPSHFVKRTIQKYVDKEVHLAPYGVDLQKWHPGEKIPETKPLTFIYAGHISIRKGLPLLLTAWRKAGLADAQLLLVGMWHLAESKKKELMPNVSYLGHRSPVELRSLFQQVDMFVFPSFFEGRALVVAEAMACGLPVIASDASGSEEVVDDSCGRIFPAGDIDALVAYFRFFAENRDLIPAMKYKARSRAETLSWENYRLSVTEAVGKYC